MLDEQRTAPYLPNILDEQYTAPYLPNILDEQRTAPYFPNILALFPCVLNSQNDHDTIVVHA